MRSPSPWEYEKRSCKGHRAAYITTAHATILPCEARLTNMKWYKSLLIAHLQSLHSHSHSHSHNHLSSNNHQTNKRLYLYIVKLPHHSSTCSPRLLSQPLWPAWLLPLQLSRDKPPMPLAWSLLAAVAQKCISAPSLPTVSDSGLERRLPPIAQLSRTSTAQRVRSPSPHQHWRP